MDQSALHAELRKENQSLSRGFYSQNLALAIGRNVSSGQRLESDRKSASGLSELEPSQRRISDVLAARISNGYLCYWTIF